MYCNYNDRPIDLFNEKLKYCTIGGYQPKFTGATEALTAKNRTRNTYVRFFVVSASVATKKILYENVLLTIAVFQYSEITVKNRKYCVFLRIYSHTRV